MASELLDTTASPSADPEQASNSIENSTSRHYGHESRFKFIRTHSRKHQQPGYESQPLPPLLPYHEYIHKLVAAGWSNLQELDDYMSTQDILQSFVVSVLDITNEYNFHLWPEIHDEQVLQRFLKEDNQSNAKSRLYMVEYDGIPSATLIETLGGSFKLDPRFFQWSVSHKVHDFTESQRRRAPFLILDFGVWKEGSPRRTDTERFKILVYIKPSKDNTGWTGFLFFSSRTKIKMSPRILIDPPHFNSELPLRTTYEPKSLRQIYIESFESIDLPTAIKSPFYTMSNMLRLNAFCWNKIITTIKDEDYRINGISDMTVSHMEEIKKSLAVVQRSGSLSWPGRDEEASKKAHDELEEDFKHLVEETALVWENRKKMAKVRSRSSETRWTTLTNVFTYGFAPVTIMSGIYGMNVSEISGTNSNPNIWQFFVAVAALSLVALVALSISGWIGIQRRHKRKAGLKEVLGLAVGKMESPS